MPPLEANICESCNEQILKAVHLIEASRFEYITLWEKFHGRVQWDEDLKGFLSTIGELDGRPVCLAWTFARLNNVPVAFFDPCSEVVDYRLIRRWVDQRCGEGTHLHDADNFHLVVHTIEGR